jgi:ubiquinone/menaquinone biosynthesis C-methylase UbiE
MMDGQSEPLKRTPVIGASGKRIWNLAQELIEPAPRGKLLEVAAGGGFLSADLAKRGFEVTGSDFVNQWQFADIPFVPVDLDEPLPFQDQEFDAIMFTEAIGYIENPCATIREFHRILKPNGIVVITMPNVFALQTRFKFLMSGTYRWFPHPVYKGQSKSELSDVYRDPMRLTTLIFNLERHGFVLEEIRFGGGKALQIFALYGLVLQLLTKLENALRKKRRTPEMVNSFPALFRTNVGVRVRKKP